jgi:regulator of cell morphogenesis and NO signaling
MTTSTLNHATTVGELAADNPLSIRVFESWKIDYCCGGRTPIGDACAAAGKTIDQFIAALESAATTGDKDGTDWQKEKLAGVSTQICEIFHRVTREELATIAPIAAKVLGVHGERHAELAEVVALVSELTSDMLPHMLKEEQVLFPYVTALEAAEIEKRPAPTPFFGTVKNPVRMMMLEHDRVGELLASLRRVTGDYVAPADSCFSYRELYRRLAELETLTHEHIHVENNIYFPRAVALEEIAGQPAAFGEGGCGMHSHSGC